MTPNVCRSSAELRPNSLMLPSRTEPNIRPNPSAELRRLPNFGPSLVTTSELKTARQFKKNLEITRYEKTQVHATILTAVKSTYLRQIGLHASLEHFKHRPYFWKASKQPRKTPLSDERNSTNIKDSLHLMSVRV